MHDWQRSTLFFQKYFTVTPRTSLDETLQQSIQSEQTTYAFDRTSNTIYDQNNSDHLVLKPVFKQKTLEEIRTNSTLGQDINIGGFVKDVYLPKQQNYMDRNQFDKNPTPTLKSIEEIQKEFIASQMQERGKL